MEKENKYEYSLLTVFDEDNCGWDYPIDVLLDNGLDCMSKEEKISYLRQFGIRKSHKKLVI